MTLSKQKKEYYPESIFPFTKFQERRGKKVITQSFILVQSKVLLRFIVLKFISAVILTPYVN